MVSKAAGASFSELGTHRTLTLGHKCSPRMQVQNTGTVTTKIIGHHARTLELPLLVRSVSQVRAERESSRGVSPPNLEGEILDVLAPCPIISVFTGI